MRSHNLTQLLMVLVAGTTCLGQEDVISQYCAEHFTGGVVIRPQRTMQSKAGREILQATFGNDLDATLSQLEAVIGIAPNRIEEVAFLVDQELADNIEKKQHPESLHKKREMLDRISFALHKFHKRNGSFPDDDGHRRTSKGNLSWRVHILPYFGYGEIYRKFRLSEPWDSPHNKRLIAEMPDCYAIPGLNVERGHTCMHVFTGKGSVFHGDVQPSLRDMPDGPESTTLAVVSGTDRAAVWTKPGGLDFDPKDPMASLGNVGDSALFLTAAKGSLFTVAALQFFSRVTSTLPRSCRSSVLRTEFQWEQSYPRIWPDRQGGPQS